MAARNRTTVSVRTRTGLNEQVSLNIAVHRIFAIPAPAPGESLLRPNILQTAINPAHFLGSIFGPASVPQAEVRRASESVNRILEESHLDGPVTVHYNRSYSLRVYVIRSVEGSSRTRIIVVGPDTHDCSRRVGPVEVREGRHFH